MQIRSMVAASLLAAAALATPNLVGHASQGVTRAYAAASPTGAGSCSTEPAQLGSAGEASLPNVGAVCWELDGSAGVASVQVNDDINTGVSGSWEVLRENPAGGIATLLASGDFCGAATIAVPAGGNLLLVALGGTAVQLPNGWVPSVGSRSSCPSPVHGTATALLP